MGRKKIEGVIVGNVTLEIVLIEVNPFSLTFLNPCLASFLSLLGFTMVAGPLVSFHPRTLVSFFSLGLSFFLLSSNTASTEFEALRLTFCGATVRKVTLNPNFNHQILVNVELCLESFRPKSSLQEYLDTNFKFFHHYQHYPRVVMTH